MNLSWKKLRETSQRVGYRNILTKYFRLPDGNEHEFTIIKYSDGAAVFGLTKDQKVIVTRQFRPGLEKVMEELPGGMVDPGEEPIVAAAREFREETGYVGGTLEFIGSMSRDAYIEGTWHYFIARDCERVGEPELDVHEFIEVATITIPELLKNIETANMTDPGGALLALRKLGL